MIPRIPLNCYDVTPVPSYRDVTPVPSDYRDVTPVPSDPGAIAPVPSAANSPKAFQVERSDPESPCGKSPAVDDVEALVVYHKDVVSITPGQLAEVVDFDIALETSATADVSWSKVVGPESGALLNAAHAVATYRNPKAGGLYQFDLGIGAESGTRTQLWLPVAGPDITQWVLDEIAFLDSFADDYHATSGLVTKTPFIGKYFRAAAYAPLAAGADWLGSFYNDLGPCGGPRAFNVFDYRHTIAGVVVERHKLSNMLTAYLGRAMTGWAEDELTARFTQHGTTDDMHAVASYQIGYDLFSFKDLTSAMADHGYAAQAPASWAREEWPNPDQPTGGAIVRPPSLQ